MCLYIAGVEPDLLVDVVLAGRLAFPVRVFFLAGLGYTDLGSQELVDFLHPRCKLVGVPSPWGLVGYYRLEPHAGVEPIVGKERCHLDALVQGIVQSELRKWQPQHPVVLKVRDMSSQVLFQK